MKLLQISAYAADFEGNFIKSLKEIEKQLSYIGDSIIYAFPENAKNKKWMKDFKNNRTVYFLPLDKARIKTSVYKKVCKIVNDEKIDVIHSHFELYDLHASYAARKYAAKVIWHLHDPIAPKEKFSRKLLRKIQYKLFGSQAKMTSVSEFYGEQSVIEGMPKNNVTTILNGIDTDFIKDASDANKNFDFFTIGWDFLRKGADIVFDACHELSAAGYDFSLLFCGNEQTWFDLDKRFPNGDPKWLVRKNPVSDINELYKASKSFISASRRETFSYAVCEAAYAGLPVVSTDIAGLEWTDEIPIVLHIESENKEQLKNKMIYLIENDFSISHDDLNKSRRIIEEKYSTVCWAKNIISAYKNC